jgi:predicted nucleic acid-binding OB-fold protein
LVDIVKSFNVTLDSLQCVVVASDATDAIAEVKRKYGIAYASFQTAVEIAEAVVKEVVPTPEATDATPKPLPEKPPKRQRKAG